MKSQPSNLNKLLTSVKYSKRTNFSVNCAKNHYALVVATLEKVPPQM